MSELAATAMATARLSRHLAFTYRTSLVTPLAKVVAVTEVANSDTDLRSYTFRSYNFVSKHNVRLFWNGRWQQTYQIYSLLWKTFRFTSIQCKFT